MNRFIIADASKCIGCRTCEVACVVSHQENQDCASLTPETFLPRIHVIKGVNISTATVCRQCEDAPCANVCPNGAISRDKGFVHVMQEVLYQDTQDTKNHYTPKDEPSLFYLEGEE